MSEDLHVNVRSIFGQQTQRGLVELTVGDQDLQITPAKAREIAAFLVEAATAAEGDETLMRVLARVGMSPQRATHVLLAMRTERGVIQRRSRDEARQAIAYDQTNPDQPE
jgi:hypothetical protein